MQFGLAGHVLSHVPRTAAGAPVGVPPPPNPQGNSKNSGFQANAFVVWIDGVRQGPGVC